jgi:hypothetical protein
MSSDLALRDWFSGFSECRAVTVLCAVIFHTHTKSALFRRGCSGPRKINPLFLPVHTRSGAPRREACRVNSFVSNQYACSVIKVYEISEYIVTVFSL